MRKTDTLEDALIGAGIAFFVAAAGTYIHPSASICGTFSVACIVLALIIRFTLAPLLGRIKKKPAPSGNEAGCRQSTNSEFKDCTIIINEILPNVKGGGRV